MALLPQPTKHQNPFAQVIGDALAPAGTHVATIIDFHDQFEVQRQRFQSDEIEKVDLTCFLFGFRDAQGHPHKVASRLMRISGNEKSALFGFLKSLLGRAPTYGWDYGTLKGTKCLLTVEHIQKRDGSGVFAGIAALSPLPPGLAQPTPVPIPTPIMAPPPGPPALPPAPAQVATPPPSAPAINTNGDEVSF